MVRTYTTKASAKRAIMQQGIQGVPHDFVTAPGGFQVLFYCELDEDVVEIASRGFLATQAEKK